MSFGIRIAATLLVLGGIVLPIISTVLTGITAQRANTGATTIRQISRHTWIHTATCTLGLGFTLSLIMVIGGALGYWAFITGITLLICSIGGGANAMSALERLDAYHNDQQGAVLRTISSAPSSRASN